MKDEVFLTSTQVLSDLKSALLNFDERASAALLKAESEIEEMRSWLEERRAHWLRQVDHAEQQLASAEAALSSCEDGGYYDDEGDWVEPDCSSESDVVDTARWQLESNREQLQKVETWVVNCEVAISEYQKIAGGFNSTISTRSAEAIRFLGEKVQQYGSVVQGTITGNNLGPNSGSPRLHPTRAAAAAQTLLAELLHQAGLLQGEDVTPAQVAALRRSLRKQPPLEINDVLSVPIKTKSDRLSATFISDVVADFLSMVPRALKTKLPNLEISVVLLPSHLAGGYDGGGKLYISSRLDAFAARATIFHELGHWLHSDGPAWYRNSIRKHFEARTAGEPIAQLEGFKPGTVGKRDMWLDGYAGRIYPKEISAEGREVVSVHLEKLALSDEQLADNLNDKWFRDTLEVVLEIFRE